MNMIAQGDDAWKKPGTLSQKAVRAVVSTAGVSTVLVGMRKEAYVLDVLAELQHASYKADRSDSWARMQKGAQEIFPD